MKTENLSTLKIHKLTKTQYKRELDAGRIDENALYLTPSEEVNSVNGKTMDTKIDKIKVLIKYPVGKSYGVLFIQFSYTFHKYNHSAPSQV